MGRVVLENDELVFALRVSPDGHRLAIAANDNSRPDIILVDERGEKRLLTNHGEWFHIRGLAWSPDGEEVWFAGAREGARLSVYAVKLDGSVRTILEAPVSLNLLDVASDGRLLVASEARFTSVVGRRDMGEPRELSWLDRTLPMEVSRSGDEFLFNEAGSGVRHGKDVMSFTRRIDGSTPRPVSTAWTMALSPDRKEILEFAATGDVEHLRVRPAGAGPGRLLRNGPVTIYKAARWTHDGRSVVFVGIEPGKRRRIYLQELAGGDPRAITPEGSHFFDYQNPDSPDGSRLFARDDSEAWRLYPTSGGAPRDIPGLVKGDVPLRWSAEGKLFIERERSGGRGSEIHLVDVDSGSWSLHADLPIIDPAGLTDTPESVISPDGRTIVTMSNRSLSQVYLVDGLR